MSKVLEYNIVECKTVRILVNMINAYITDGWEPIGGVAILQTAEFVPKEYYIQAVVRRGEEA